MKYRIVEEPDGTHRLYRHDELSLPNAGIPNNAELEFWFEIEALRDKVLELGVLLRSLEARNLSGDRQFQAIAKTLGGDARHVKVGDKSIAGLVKQEIDRYRGVLEEIVESGGSDGCTHSGDQHAQCRAWARRALKEMEER